MLVDSMQNTKCLLNIYTVNDALINTDMIIRSLRQQQRPTVSDGDDLETLANVDDDAGHGVVGVESQQRLVHDVDAQHAELLDQHVHKLLFDFVGKVSRRAEHDLKQ